MKTINLNRNSWHGQLAYAYGPMYENTQTTDLCSYMRAMVLGLLRIVSVIVAVTVLFGWHAIDFMAWVVSGLVNGWVEPDVGAMVLMILAGVAVVCGIVYVFSEVVMPWWKERQRAAWKAKGAVTVPDSFLVVAYASLKNKYCVNLNIKGCDENKDE